MLFKSFPWPIQRKEICTANWYLSLMLLSNNLMCCLNINQFPVVKLQLITSADNGWNNSIMVREQINSTATILIISSQGTFLAERVLNKKTYEPYFCDYKQTWMFFSFFPQTKAWSRVEQLLYVSQYFSLFQKRYQWWFCFCINVILYLHQCFHKK